MKTVNRFFGNLNRARCAVPLLIIALAVIMSFAFAACDDGNNPQTKTCTVTFNADGGTPAPAQQTVDSGGKVTEPPAMTKAGYTFGGWFKESTFTNQWNFASDTVTQDITLYAKWDVAGTINYTVTFNSNGGSAVQAQTVASGEKAAEPQNVTKNGYTLAGWFRDDTAFQNQWNFATDTVTQDITLYAKWNENAPATVTVTFDTDGGSNVNSQTVETGGYINRPANNPTKTGYTFVDWYTSTEYEYLYNFNIPVNSNRTAYAKWLAHVTFNADGGTPAPAQQNIEIGGKVTEPPAMTKTGGANIFDGWYKEEEFTNQWNFATDTVTQPVTLYAKWNFQYNIGDTGPGGGKIFFRSDTGFTMTDTNETCYYLEAALTNMSTTTIAWASSGFTYTDISGTELAIGTGRRNTALILATDANAPAAKACKDYNGGGKTDWFLPSKDELNELYVNSSAVGNLGTNTYWSSSQVDGSPSSSWYHAFYSGNQGGTGKENMNRVRAVRAF